MGQRTRDTVVISRDVTTSSMGRGEFKPHMDHPPVLRTWPSDCVLLLNKSPKLQEGRYDRLGRYRLGGALAPIEHDIRLEQRI